MPVTSTETVATYAGNGSTTIPYPITILRDRDEDLFLSIGGEPSTDFSISPDGFRTGVAHASTVSLVLFRQTPRTQEQPFPSNTTPAAEDVRAGLDKLTLEVQEVGEESARAVKPPIGEQFISGSTLGLDSDGNYVSRTAEEEVSHLGIGPKVEEATQAATRAETAETAAIAAATSLNEGVYHSPATFQTYAPS